MSVEHPTGEVTVVYDGECPFCTRFVALYRLREAVGQVRLVDGRSGDPAVALVRSLGLDLDEGMVVIWNGQTYHGAAAMNVLALLGSDASLFGRINQALFRRPRLARALYPWLVRGRGLTLKLLGRRTIKDAAA
jgi:predicted DCC family thiol-disulfide oxidoreductase YuxK